MDFNFWSDEFRLSKRRRTTRIFLSLFPFSHSFLSFFSSWLDFFTRTDFLPHSLISHFSYTRHMVYHVSLTWLSMCPTCVTMTQVLMPCVTRHPFSSENMKFQLSWNSMKFAWVTRIHGKNPTVRSISSFEI